MQTKWRRERASTHGAGGCWGRQDAGGWRGIGPARRQAEGRKRVGRDVAKAPTGRSGRLAVEDGRWGCGEVAGRRGLGRGVVHFVALAVGGYEGVGEDGLGLGQQFFGLFETGADVGEEELPGLGLEGQGGGLHGGAM